jgi:hypothetical protein
VSAGQFLRDEHGGERRWGPVGGGEKWWEAVRRWGPVVCTSEPVLSLLNTGELDKNSLETACDERRREKG